VAGAVRPVVLLMLLASVLFLVTGILDGVYPGGSNWLTGTEAELAAASYLFAVVNTVVAILVARGSERSLVARVGLAAFFVFERPFSAIVLGPKSGPSIATHLITATVELVILLSALRVWQLGRSFASRDVDVLFALEGPSPASPPEPRAGERRASGAIPSRSAWVIGGIALALAIVFVADGAYEGFIPGGRDWSTSAEGSGWLVYLFSVVVLLIAARAVRGERIAMRTLVVIALIFFIERSFTPFSLKEQDPVVLALHGLGALVSLALAIATAGAIRTGPSRERSSVPTLEAA
jgi:hypothetical protein